MSPFEVLPDRASNVAKLVVAEQTRPGTMVTGNVDNKSPGWHPKMGIEGAFGPHHAEGVMVERIGVQYGGATELPTGGLSFPVNNGGANRTLKLEDITALPEEIDFSPADGGLCMTETFLATSISDDVYDADLGWCWRAGDYRFTLGGDVQISEQLPLTAEEIAEGASRATFMNYSLAFYSANKRNDIKRPDGSWVMQAANGKVGHGGRPFAICKDAQSNVLGVVYGRWESRLVSGVPSHTKLIPTSAIPVGTATLDVDATIGYTSIGATQIGQINSKIYQGSNTVGYGYEGVDGNAVSITYATIRNLTDNAAQGRAALYKFDNYSAPNVFIELVAESGLKSAEDDWVLVGAPNANTGWQTFNLTAPTAVLATEYLFPSMNVATDGSSEFVYYDSTAGISYSVFSSSPTIVYPASATANSTGREYSVYTTIETAPAPPGAGITSRLGIGLGVSI